MRSITAGLRARDLTGLVDFGLTGFTMMTEVRRRNGSRVVVVGRCVVRLMLGPIQMVNEEHCPEAPQGGYKVIIKVPSPLVKAGSEQKLDGSSHARQCFAGMELSEAPGLAPIRTAGCFTCAWTGQTLVAHLQW